jgi:hypothetical protein
MVGDMKCAAAATDAVPRVRVTNNCPFDVWLQTNDPWATDSLYETLQRNQNVTDELLAFETTEGPASDTMKILDDTARSYYQAFDNLNADNNTHQLRGTQANVANEADRQWSFHYPSQPDWWTHSSCPGSDRSSMHPSTEVCLRASGAGGLCVMNGDYTNTIGSMAACSPELGCELGESCNYGVRTCGRGGALCSLNMESNVHVCGKCCDGSGACNSTPCAQDGDCTTDGTGAFPVCVSQRSECVPISPPCFSLQTEAVPDTYVCCASGSGGGCGTTACTITTSASGDDDDTCPSGQSCTYAIGYCFTDTTTSGVISPYHGAMCGSNEYYGGGTCVTGSKCETADSACSPACSHCSAFSYACDAGDYLGDVRITTKVGCDADDPTGVNCVLGNAATTCTEYRGLTICQPEATTSFGFNISPTTSTFGMNLSNAATVPAGVVPVLADISTATQWSKCQSSQPGCTDEPGGWCPRFDPLYDCIGTCNDDTTRPVAQWESCEKYSDFGVSCTEVGADCVLYPGGGGGFCNDASRTPCTSDGSGGGDSSVCGPRVMDLRILAGDLAKEGGDTMPTCNPPGDNSVWPVFSEWKAMNCFNDDGCRVCGETAGVTPCFDARDCPQVCRHKITGAPHPDLTVCTSDAECTDPDFSCAPGSCIAAPCGSGDDIPVTGCMSPCTKLNAKTTGLTAASTPPNNAIVPFGYDQSTIDCGPKCSKCSACTGMCLDGPRVGAACFNSDECLGGSASWTPPPPEMELVKARARAPARAPQRRG